MICELSLITGFAVGGVYDTYENDGWVLAIYLGIFSLEFTNIID